MSGLTHSREGKKHGSGFFRVSLRYKLTIPILVFVSIMYLMLFYSTFHLVRTLIIERIEGRLKAITDVFSEALKVPLMTQNNEDLQSIMEWMAGREDVLEVRVEDVKGDLIASVNPTVEFPKFVSQKDFVGVQRITPDVFAVSVPVRMQDKTFGRVLVLFSQLGLEGELKNIFSERLMIAFSMLALLAVLIGIVTWIVIQPIYSLEKTTEQILMGDLEARAHIRSYDEIQDLADAFNEMVGRLGSSLERLRHRTEALEESEEKYRLVVENANDIIFTLTADGELILMNKGFSGCRREEFLHEGLSLILALHTEDSRKKFQEELETVMRNKTAVQNIAVTHIFRGSQNEVHYLVNLTPVLGHEGEVKMIQGVMRDVTELHRIEMMKESLVRDVTHELKTPAAKFEMTLNWFEKEMEKSGERDKYGEVIGILRSNVGRLMHTITSVMDLTKLESGVVHTDKTDLNLGEVLKQVCDDLAPMVKAKNLLFEFSIAPEPLRINGDRHMLYRLFSNLIQNAIKFTEFGKIALKGERAGSQILVEISDTGLGIDQNDLEIIFERFVQKTASSMGIGVGLTICRDIVSLHQGRIWAESPGLGEGATFKVEFPSL